MRPVVALSTRATEDPRHKERRDALSHDWARFLDGLGLLPLAIPNAIGDPAVLVDRVGVAAVILTGGGSVGPAPGEGGPSGGAADVEILRDRTEAKLVEWAASRGVPVLGVCRGFHALNVLHGGRLVRDLASLAPERHVGTFHEITLTEERYAKAAGGATPRVNSYHDEGVTEETLAAPLVPFATARGGIVEGFRHASLPVWGIQWHPERPSGSPDLDRAILDDWLGAAKGARP